MTTDTKQGLLDIFGRHVERAVEAVKTDPYFANTDVNNVLHMASRLYKLGYQAETSECLSRIFDVAAKQAVEDRRNGQYASEQIAFSVAEKMHLKA